MLPDRVSNPGPLTYESGALPIALRGPASQRAVKSKTISHSMDAYKRVDRRTDRRTYFHIGMHIGGQTDRRTDTHTDIRLQADRNI